MTIGLNSRFQAYTSTNLNFKGTLNPKTSAEKVQAELIQLQHTGGVDGFDQGESLHSRKVLANIIREEGNKPCSEFADELENAKVIDDIPENYFNFYRR